MQALIRSKSAGITGGRGTAGAGPGRDLLYGSRGLPAAPTNRRPGDLGPYEPCPSTPRVRIVDSVETTPEIGAIEEPRRSRAWRTPEVEARREVRHSGRGGRDMEDLVSMCQRRCQKACNLRSTADDSDEACHSGSSGGRARRYRKRGSPKSAARDAGAMDTDPSPVRLWESEGQSEGYRTAYEPPSESEMSAPIARAHTAPEPALKHDAEGLERPARARTAPVPRHTGPETDTIGDTPMGDESEVPGTAGCAESGGKHAACHCEHVSFLMGKYPKMGMDAIVHRLDRLDNAKDGLEEDVAGILDDQSAAEKDMEELRAERDQYRENLELALEKQQRVVDSLLHLVEDMSGRLKRLEELQPLSSSPELPAKPAAAELVERVKTLRSAMNKPMGGPAEAPYAPPRVDPGALPFVPMCSESTMLGEHTAPAGSMREGHVTADPRSPDGTDVPCRPGCTDHDEYGSLCGGGDPEPDHAGANHGKRRRTWSRSSRRKPVGEGSQYGDMDGRRSKPFPHSKPHGFRPNWTALHGGEGCTASVLTPPGHRWYPSRWSGGWGRRRCHQD